MKFGISTYEKFLQKYKLDITNMHENKINKVFIIDKTQLNLDKTINFDILNNCKVIDSEGSLNESIVLTLDCTDTQSGVKFIKLLFEDIMYSNVSYIYRGTVEIIFLKEGFRFEIKDKKKNKKIKQERVCLIEARRLTIEGIPEEDVLKKINSIEVKKKLDQDDLKRLLQSKWKLSYEDALEISENEFMNIRVGKYINENSELNKDSIRKSDISNDLKYFLLNIGILGCEIIDYGRTYKRDEFYLRIYRDKSHHIIERSGYITDIEDNRYGYELIQIKFIGVISIDIDDLALRTISYRYEKIYGDNSYKLGLCSESYISGSSGLRRTGNFITIHAKDLEIEVLDME